MFSVLNIIYLAGIEAMMSIETIFMSFGISLVVGIIIAVSLLSQSRTKIKASKADKYISSSLKLTQSSDVYTHTTTTKHKVN